MVVESNASQEVGKQERGDFPCRGEEPRAHLWLPPQILSPATNILACSAPNPGRKCSEVPLKGTGVPCYWLDGRPRFLSWDFFQGRFLPLGPLSLFLFLAKAIWQKDLAQKQFLSHPGHEHCSPWVWGLGWHVGWGGHWDGLSPSLGPKHQGALNSRGNLGEL